MARLLGGGVFGPCVPEQLYERLIKVAAGMLVWIQPRA